MRTQRRPMLGFSADAVANTKAFEPAVGRSFSPIRPMSAGNNVIAATMAIATAMAAEAPMTLRKGMPTTKRPSKAMITVRPANTTALPAVPTAVAADSSAPWPLAN